MRSAAATPYTRDAAPMVCSASHVLSDVSRPRDAVQRASIRHVSAVLEAWRRRRRSRGKIDYALNTTARRHVGCAAPRRRVTAQRRQHKRSSPLCSGDVQCWKPTCRDHRIERERGQRGRGAGESRAAEQLGDEANAAPRARGRRGEAPPRTGLRPGRDSLWLQKPLQDSHKRPSLFFCFLF